MDFGEIFNRWENKSKNGKEKKSASSRVASSREKELAHEALEKWLEKVDDWETIHRSKEDTAKKKQEPAPRTVLRKMPPQETLDLHGMDSVSARRALASFIDSSHRKNLKKVLIVHGKGIHSPDGPVLREVVRAYLSSCPHAGETGTPGRDLGGSGSTWVILK